MDSYQIFYPSASLFPYVKQYWFLKSACRGHIQGIIPTGYISLFFHRAYPLFSVEKQEMQPAMHINGQSTTYSNLLLSELTDMICIDILPQAAKLFFNIPMDELKESCVALDLLADPFWLELGKRLADTYDNQECVYLIEHYLKKRISFSDPYNLKRITAAIKAINEGETGIDKLADMSCLSYKQFKRVFSAQTGANPRDFLRIVRFQRALYTLQQQPQTNLTGLAYICGYYDQSHLIREFKSFSGYTPGEFLNVCKPYSDYFT